MKTLKESILDTDFDFNLPTNFPDSSAFIDITTSTEWEWFKSWGDQLIISKESTIFQDIYKYFSKFWGKGRQSHKTPVLVTHIPGHQGKIIRIEYIKSSLPNRTLVDRTLVDVYLIKQEAKSIVIRKTKNFNKTIEDISNENVKWCWFPIDLLKYLDWLIDTTK